MLLLQPVLDAGYFIEHIKKWQKEGYVVVTISEGNKVVAAAGYGIFTIIFLQKTMKLRSDQIIEWFLRISLSAGFLSAVADRVGIWDKAHSAWGDWQTFIDYTHMLNPWFPESAIPFIGGLATMLEILFAVCLLTKFKTVYTAAGSGILLLLFALAMTISNSIKAPLDYSVFTASAAAFSLAILKSQNN